MSVADSVPNDYREFVGQGGMLEYDSATCQAGQITLKKTDELRLRDVYLRFLDTEFELEDPHLADDGYYVVVGVSLVEGISKRVFLADSILLWFPSYGRFGTWDTNHDRAYTFAEVAWRDIVRDPLRYLNAQWTLEAREMRPIVPWRDGEYEFRVGEVPNFWY